MRKELTQSDTFKPQERKDVIEDLLESLEDAGENVLDGKKDPAILEMTVNEYNRRYKRFITDLSDLNKDTVDDYREEYTELVAISHSYIEVLEYLENELGQDLDIPDRSMVYCLEYQL